MSASPLFVGIDVAKAAGQLAKTDRIDAHVLDLFAGRVRHPVRPLHDDSLP